MKALISISLAFFLVFWGIPSLVQNSYNSRACLFAQQEELPQEEEKKQEELQEEELKEELPVEEKKPIDTTQQEVMEPEQEPMTDIPQTAEERMKFWRAKFDTTYDSAFEDVWNSVKNSLKDANCQILKEKYSQTDQGLYKGSIISDYCLFSTGSDSTWDKLKLFSIKVPVIRGGVWVTGRFQYKFTIQENENATVYMQLKGEVSGFEEYVTYSVHFWDSNGYLETKMMDRVKRNIEFAQKK